MEEWLCTQSCFGKAEAAENVEQVSQSSGWWQRGPAERGHQERPQHYRWRWDDTHPSGSLPRVPGGSGGHLPEGVSQPASPA